MIEETLDLPEQSYGPGKILRAKREEYEWSVEAVAEALHLSTHSVKAIEADRYDDLPGATYVIGYWRSYARLLGVDIEETIEANKQNLNIVTAEAAGVDVHRHAQNKKGTGGLLLLLLLVSLGAFAYYAWQQQFFGLLGDQTPILNQAPVEQVAVPVEVIEEEKLEQVLRPLDSAQSEGVENVNRADTVVKNDTPEPAIPVQSGLVMPTTNNQASTFTSSPLATQGGLVLATGTGSTGDSGADQNQPQTQTSINREASAPTQENDDSGASDPVVVQPSEPVAAASRPVNDASSMIVKLDKDSWLDIRDKTNTRLVYKTESAGKEITVKGTPPFYIYIGTPDGVTIRYQGKNVPFETHKSGLFARFKLGEGILESL